MADKPYRLLYVDDEPSNLKLVSYALQSRDDIEFHSADTGAKGLQQAAALSPQLIFLDISLPDMSGYDVLQQLKATDGLNSIPVIALSAHVLPNDIEKGLAAGFDRYIGKPLDVHMLLELVQEYLPA
jgi:CheY-like chemotaxis protein